MNTTPSNAAQTAGKFAEQTGEFLLPGRLVKSGAGFLEGAARGADLRPIGMAISNGMNAAENAALVGRAAQAAAGAGVVRAAQTGDVSEGLKTGAVAGALPIVGTGIGAVARRLAESTLNRPLAEMTKLPGQLQQNVQEALDAGLTGGQKDIGKIYKALVDERKRLESVWAYRNESPLTKAASKEINKQILAFEKQLSDISVKLAKATGERPLSGLTHGVLGLGYGIYAHNPFVAIPALAYGVARSAQQNAPGLTSNLLNRLSQMTSTVSPNMTSATAGGLSQLQQELMKRIQDEQQQP